MDGAAYDAVILAGGGGRRLGGAAKPQLVVGGVTLLDRVLAAVRGAATTVVAGPQQPTARPVRWAREDPPGTGPVAALAAAVPLTAAPVVLVLAADLPWIAGALGALRAAVPADGVALLTDAAGRRNNLAAAWRRPALVAALDRLGPPAGAAVRGLIAAVPVVEIADTAGWGADCDTWDDVAAARRELS